VPASGTYSHRGIRLEAASKKIPDCELVILPGTGHFEPYTGEFFERVVEREAEFLCKHLLS